MSTTSEAAPIFKSRRGCRRRTTQAAQRTLHGRIALTRDRARPQQRGRPHWLTPGDEEGCSEGEGVKRTMDRKAHWDRVYATKASEEVSWFQPEPTVSLRLLERSGLTVAT